MEEIYGSDKLPKFPGLSLFFLLSFFLFFVFEGKKLIGNTDEKFLQKRARKLSTYLDGIVKLDNILNIPEVRSFLMTTVSAKDEDELLPVFQTEEERLNLDALLKESDKEDVSDLSEITYSEMDSQLDSPIMSPRQTQKLEELFSADGEEFIALFDYDGKAEVCFFFCYISYQLSIIFTTYLSLIHPSINPSVHSSIYLFCYPSIYSSISSSSQNLFVSFDGVFFIGIIVF